MARKKKPVSWRQEAWDRLTDLTSIHSIADHKGGIDRSSVSWWRNVVAPPLKYTPDDMVEEDFQKTLKRP